MYLALLVCSTLAATPSAHAINWFADEVTIKTENDPNIGFEPVCGFYPLLPVFLTVAKQASPWDSSESVNASGCIEFGKNADMARYFTNTFSTQTRAVRIHGDATFHDYVGPEGVILPESDTQVLTTSAGIAAAPKTRLYTTRNFSTTLKPMMRNSQGVVTSYSADLTKLETWMWDESDTSKQHSVVPVTVSENGRYVIAYVDNKGYVKIDLDRRTVTKILDRVVPSDKPYVTHWNHVGGVSSEGRYVVVGDFQNDATLLVDTENCGDEFGRGFVAPMKSSCRTLDLEKLAEQKTGKNFNGFSKKTFLKDGSLTLESSDLSSGAKMRLTLQKYGHVEPALYYLALGDSYSSGEGDIDKKSDGSSYYIAGTEQDGQCHVSSRSYPYLLRDYWKIPGNKMASVACSGAWVTKDFTSELSTYLGQHNELAGKEIELQNESRSHALNHYGAGVVPQIEFVKKYKPRIVTIMGGGNDVGFSDILSYCASPFSPLPVSETCAYATSGELHNILWDSIHTQYDYEVSLLRKLKSASPNTSFYVIGYPSFISSDAHVCSLNAALLDRDEAIMINDALREMNKTLEAAADSEGIRFIDIEDALKGGRLCEGAEYMTGFIDGGAKSDNPNIFHPNSRGHAEIAKVIKNKIGENPYLVEHTTPITREKIERGVPTYPAVLVKDPIVSVDSRMTIALSGEFYPGDITQLSVFSQKFDLGLLTADENGSIGGEVDVSRLPAGKHLLLLEGISTNKSKIRFYQFISIHSNSLKSEKNEISLSDNKNVVSTVLMNSTASNMDSQQLRYDFSPINIVELNKNENTRFISNMPKSAEATKAQSARHSDVATRNMNFILSFLLIVAALIGLMQIWRTKQY